jgi:hypothetical protein
MPFIKIHYTDSLTNTDTKVTSNCLHESLKINFNIPSNDIFYLFQIYKPENFTHSTYLR